MQIFLLWGKKEKRRTPPPRVFPLADMFPHETNPIRRPEASGFT